MAAKESIAWLYEDPKAEVGFLLVPFLACGFILISFTITNIALDSRWLVAPDDFVLKSRRIGSLVHQSRSPTSEVWPTRSSQIPLGQVSS